MIEFLREIYSGPWNGHFDYKDSIYKEYIDEWQTDIERKSRCPKCGKLELNPIMYSMTDEKKEKLSEGEKERMYWLTQHHVLPKWLNGKSGKLVLIGWECHRTYEDIVAEKVNPFILMHYIPYFMYRIENFFQRVEIVENPVEYTYPGYTESVKIEVEPSSNIF